MSLAKIFRYALQSTLQTSRVYRYNIANAVPTVSRIYRYNLANARRTRPSLQIPAYLSAHFSPGTYRYSISGRVTLPRIIKYNITTAVSLSRIYRYVLGTGNLVNHDLQIYNSLTGYPLLPQKAYKYTILNRLLPGSSIIYKYNLLVRLDAPSIRTYRYNLLTLFQRLETFKYTLIARVSVSRVYRYRLGDGSAPQPQLIVTISRVGYQNPRNTLTR